MMVAVPALPALLFSVASFAGRRINSISLMWKAVILSFLALCNNFRDQMDFDLNRHVKGAVNAMGKKWTIKGPGSTVTRSIQVWTFAIAWYVRFLQAQRLKKGGAATALKYSQAKTELAVLLRDKLLDLGPTYIKLGQLLSTRIDVLDKEYINVGNPFIYCQTPNTRLRTIPSHHPLSTSTKPILSTLPLNTSTNQHLLTHPLNPPINPSSQYIH